MGQILIGKTEQQYNSTLTGSYFTLTRLKKFTVGDFKL